MSSFDGTVIDVKASGSYTLEDTIVKLSTKEGEKELKLYQYWPVRVPRPVKKN